MDFHCDGKVNYSEFLAATISTINFNKEEKLWSAFKYFDTTDSGYITLDSVMDALKDSGVIIDEEGLKNTFNELQKKGKKINFNEFKAIALGKEIIEEEHEHEYSSKESDMKVKNKINLKFNFKKNINETIETEKEKIDNNIRKVETVFIKEEKKDSQDIFFEKVNFSTNNLHNENNSNNKENKENNNKETKNNEDNNKNDKSEKKNEGNNGDTGNKNNIKSNNKSSKSNNKSSKSYNKSNKSNNKSSKSYNKSSKSNNKSSKSNMDILIEEQSIDNNDKFTEVNEILE